VSFFILSFTIIVIILALTNLYKSWFKSIQEGTIIGGKNLKVDKFTGRNNFSLWQIKIWALLKQHGLWTPLLKPAPNPLPADIATREEKAHSTLLLAFDDHVITKVAEEDTNVGLWCKLESLYMTKSLTNKLL